MTIWLYVTVPFWQTILKLPKILLRKLDDCTDMTTTNQRTYLIGILRPLVIIQYFKLSLIWNPALSSAVVQSNINMRDGLPIEEEAFSVGFLGQDKKPPKISMHCLYQAKNIID